MNKARIFPNWSFEKSFIDSHYLNVIKNLTEEDKLSCNNITFGDIFSNDANGYAENNKKWGKIVYLNECLQFYMKFCNLALLDFNGKVPDKVRLLSNIDIPKEFNKNKFEKLKENAKQLKDWLVEDINFNYDIYDFYGSIYLDKPNTKWRGKELIDRVDY